MINLTFGRSPVGWKTFGKRGEMFLHISIVGYMMTLFFFYVFIFNVKIQRECDFGSYGRVEKHY